MNKNYKLKIHCKHTPNYVSKWYLFCMITYMDNSAYDKRMQKSYDFLVNELAWVQAWRATRWLVENISVDTSYGTMHINQLANITIADTQSIKIEARDKNVLNAIEKAIYNAWTWLAPKNEWEFIIVNVPPLTGERRQEIVKQIHAMGEEAKTSLRQIRHDYLKDLKAKFEDSDISEDEKKEKEDKADEEIKKYTDKINDTIKHKENDILHN